MKARVHADDSKIILSIGMIVKNEEKFLRDCLTALKPLMQQVRSELIIVDTGSTDKTVEIAKEFTDQVVFFEWCNDFAAARNCGLSMAHGEWFMFIDADEHFVQVKGIADFLNNPNNKDFDFAAYTLRNFFDAKRQSFADYPARRLFKRYDGIKFEHPIHEGIESRPNDILYIIPDKALANHYGYSSELGNKYREEKHERNSKLLKAALDKNPEDGHMIIHMVKECISCDETDDAIKYCLQGIELGKKQPYISTRCYYYNKLMASYFKQNKVNKVFETAKEYFDRSECPYTTDLDIYFNRAAMYMQLSEFENAKKDFESYFECYQAYCEKKLLTNDMFVDPIVTTQKDYYYRALSNYSICQTKLEEYDEALATLEKVKPRDVGVQNDDLCYLVAECTLIEQTENYKRIAVLYDQVKAQDDEEKLKIVQRYIEGFMVNCKESRTEIPKILVDKFKNLDSDYIKLQRLRIAAVKRNRTELHSLLKSFLDNALTVEYSDVLYFALKEDFDISLLAKVVDFEDVPTFFIKIKQKYGGYAELVYHYFVSHAAPSTLLELRVVVELKECALLDDDFDEAFHITLFKSYCADLILYVYNVTTPQMLEKENITGLPKLYRFAYDMSMAKKHLEENQTINYIKALKSALCSNQNMKRPIKMLLAEFEDKRQEEEKEQDERQKEFNTYAATLKVKVKQLMQAGEYTAAGQIIEALEKLLPNDKELKRYQAALKEKTK